MSQIMKSFLAIFLVMFMVVCSISILSSYILVIQAQDQHASMIDAMENSNYYAPVIREYMREANDLGYDVRVTLYMEDHSSTFCDSVLQIPDNTKNVDYASVELDFPFQIPFFGIYNMHTLTGFAR